MYSAAIASWFMSVVSLFYGEWLSSLLVELYPVLVRRTGGIIRGMKFNKRVLWFKETNCNKTHALEYYSFEGHNRRSSCIQGGLFLCLLVLCFQGESKCIIIDNLTLSLRVRCALVVRKLSLSPSPS